MRTVSHRALGGHLGRVLAGALLSTALCACGYKGPLTMPKPSPPPESLTKPPALPNPPANPDAAVPSPVQ
ncbi:MAG: hypothetical protein EPN41_00325 [Candidimonas sp.]|nr:MAG: hypothetical protein EPN41_00325 [Candidimonas sp.]